MDEMEWCEWCGEWRTATWWNDSKGNYCCGECDPAEKEDSNGTEGT